VETHSSQTNQNTGIALHSVRNYFLYICSVKYAPYHKLKDMADGMVIMVPWGPHDSEFLEELITCLLLRDYSALEKEKFV
jgi:hypothetical protein